MKYLIALYVMMMLIVYVNLISEFILGGRYLAIASWIICFLFFFRTIFFTNVRYYLRKNGK